MAPWRTWSWGLAQIPQDRGRQDFSLVEALAPLLHPRMKMIKYGKQALTCAADNLKFSEAI